MCTVDAQNLAFLPVLHELVNFGEKVGNNILAWQLGETWLFLKLCCPHVSTFPHPPTLSLVWSIPLSCTSAGE